MKTKVKKLSKRIMGWCVSNILWDFIVRLFSVILLIPILKDIGIYFVTKTYNVKLYHIILVITFMLLEGIAIVTHKKRKDKIKTEIEVSDMNADNDDDDLLNDADLVATQEILTDEDKYADIDDFYFETYTKHITIYKDGHGIVINTFNIHVLNANNLKIIKRRLNVEDGKKSINLPPLSMMKKTHKSNRFNDYGFWVFKPADSIINSTMEDYWSDDGSDVEDTLSKNNPKEIKWIFKINQNKLRASKTHKISYALSIPGMFPVKNGEYDIENANTPNETGYSSSSIEIRHPTKKLTYIISVESGISLDCTPTCECIYYNRTTRKSSNVECNITEGVFYTKYIFTIDEPKQGNSVVVKWRFKN